MAIALTATPLPSEAAVRLRLDSVVGYNTVLSDYSVGSASENVADVLLWVTSGGTNVIAQAGRLRVQFPAPGGGTGYVTRTFGGLTVGQRYTVNVWVQGFANGVEVKLGRGATAVRSIYGTGYASAGPNAGIGPTLLTYEFVASATSEAVRLTGLTAGGIAGTFDILGVSIRNVPTARFKFMQDTTVSDAANWTGIATVPTGGAVFGPGASTTALPSGVSQILTYTEYRSTGTGVTATWPSGTGIKRTISGLTVGQKYRVSLAAQGQVTTFVNNSVTSAAPLRVQVGVQGVGSGLPSTSGWATYDFVATASSHVVTASYPDTFTTYGGSGADRQLGQLWQRGLYVEDLYVSLSDAYTLKSLTRADNNGTRPVRLYEGQGLSDGALVTTDPEPALSGLISYTAVVRDVVGGTDVTVFASTSLDGQVTRSRIAPASIPSQGQWYDLAPDISLDRASTTTLAQVINRPDPIVTLGTQALRAGTLSIFADDYAMGTALESVFNRGEIVFVRQPDHPGLDMYIVGTRTSLRIQPELTRPRRWVLDVDYAEVAAPTTPLRGSIGWTIAESLERNPTLAASRAEFPTVLSLLLGPDA